MTLQDLITIIVGTIATACVFACGSWAWENRVKIADYYFTSNLAYRLHVMSNDEYTDINANDEIAEDSPATTTPQNNNNAIANTQNDSNDLLQAKALARLIKAGKVGQTEGIEIVFGVKPSSTNKRYKSIREMVQTEMLVNDSYPRMTPEQQAFRKAIGMEK